MAFPYCNVKYASITIHKHYLSLKESPAIWHLYWPQASVSLDLADKVGVKHFSFLYIRLFKYNHNTKTPFSLFGSSHSFNIIDAVGQASKTKDIH